MKRVLGIDLGTNSLGWGIIENQRIIDCGVLVFDQGIPLVKGIESANSPAAERTAFRAARRLKYRRRLRKYHTLKILIENNMCPLSLPELKDWIRKGNFPVDNAAFIGWLNSTCESNPYYFRAKAASEKVSPFELGRALYHIAIRRGFKSSKKDQSSSNAKETSELKNSIKQLEEKLLISGQTLGQYLYELVKIDSKIRGHIKCGRVEHYIPEFETICRVQNISGELKKKLYDALFLQRPLRSKRYLVGKCSLEKNYPRALIAHPLFEKYRMLSFVNTIKVQIDDEPERFLDSEERQTAITAFMVKTKNLKFEKIKTALVKKHFKNRSVGFNYRDDQSCTSSALIYQLQKILGCDDLFAWKRNYLDVKKHEKCMDYQAVFDGLKYFNIDFDGDPAAFRKFAVERLGLTEDSAEEFMKIDIPDGYAKYSLYAIRKIVPFLEAGYIEPYAVFLAKVPDILGKHVFESKKEEILADFQQCLEDYTWEKQNLDYRERKHILSLSARFKQLLEEKWKCSPEKIAKLYEFKEQSNYTDHISEGVLPHIELGMIYNPMVHRSLTVLRRLVNSLRLAGKIDADTEIHIELARNVNDKTTRMAIQEMQKSNEKLREQARAEFAEYGITPTDEQILRWRLWKEQNGICIYTGRKISSGEIFTNEFSSLDIEHTIPRSAGGESNLENLTLCDSTYNRSTKKDKLPSECPNYDAPVGDLKISIREGLMLSGFEEALENAEKVFAEASHKLKAVPASSPNRASVRQRQIVAYEKRKYWRLKLLSFEMGREEATGNFSRRQLVATGVMSRHALQFLRSTYPDVYANNGTVTAFARKEWGLQSQFEKKERADHIHHVIDALVIAAIDRESLNKIAHAHHEGDVYRDGRSVVKIASPWQSFAQDVYFAVENVLVKRLVSHNETKQAKRNRVYLATPVKGQDGAMIRHFPGTGDTVRGQLHDQTYYGRILDSAQEVRTVLRTVLDSKNFSSIEALREIVDKGVREAIIEQLELRMADGTPFAEALDSGVCMKTKNGTFDGPAIKKVRIFRDDISPLTIKRQTYSGAAEYKNYYYAETAKGGNFMIALYRNPQTPAGQKVYDYELISLWQWAEEHRREDYIPPQNRTDKGEFIGIVNPGVSVLFYKDSPEELKTMSQEQLAKRLYIVTEFKKDGRICLRWHREARSKKDAETAMKETFNVQALSKIEWENPAFLLCLRGKTYQNHTLFAGIDFNISVDGEITFVD